jgi:hypothetical protein
MVLVEDRSYEVRRIEEFLRQEEEVAKKRAAQVHPEKQHVLDIIQGAGEPILIVDVANQFSHEAGHHWDSRATKADLRLRAFRMVAMCVKEFLIARHRRRWVVYLGPTNPRRQAFLEEIENTVKNFSKPRI